MLKMLMTLCAFVNLRRHSLSSGASFVSDTFKVWWRQRFCNNVTAESNIKSQSYKRKYI